METPTQITVTTDSGVGLCWAARVVCLALVAGGWLLYAAGLERWRLAEDLRTRGGTAVARVEEKPFDERLRELGKVHFSEPRRKYQYVVEGRTYDGEVTGEDPKGQTVTYLPENPATHQLGTVQPEPPGVGGVLILLVLAAIYTGLAVLFFLTCMISPRADGNPTALGWWLIFGLAAAQAAAVFPALTAERLPLSVVLTRHVPAFVVATVAAVLGVRLVAWWRGAVLSHTPPATPEGTWHLSHGEGGAAVWTDEKGEPLPAEARAHAEEMRRHFAGSGAIQGPEPESSPTGPAPDLPWLFTPCAALAGAAACVGVASVGLAVMHFVALVSQGAGCLTDSMRFLTTRDSLVVDLIVATVAALFGAIRGVAHAGRLKERPARWGAACREIAGKAADDLGKLRHPLTFAEGAEAVASLFMAAVLSLPVIVLLLVFWSAG